MTRLLKRGAMRKWRPKRVITALALMTRGGSESEK